MAYDRQMHVSAGQPATLQPGNGTDTRPGVPHHPTLLSVTSCVNITSVIGVNV